MASSALLCGGILCYRKLILFLEKARADRNPDFTVLLNWGRIYIYDHATTVQLGEDDGFASVPKTKIRKPMTISAMVVG